MPSMTGVDENAPGEQCVNSLIDVCPMTTICFYLVGKIFPKLQRVKISTPSMQGFIEVAVILQMNLSVCPSRLILNVNIWPWWNVIVSVVNKKLCSSQHTTITLAFFSNVQRKGLHNTPTVLLEYKTLAHYGYERKTANCWSSLLQRINYVLVPTVYSYSCMHHVLL